MSEMTGERGGFNGKERAPMRLPRRRES